MLTEKLASKVFLKNFSTLLYFKSNLNNSEWLVKFDDKIEEENSDYLENQRSLQKEESKY